MGAGAPTPRGHARPFPEVRILVVDVGGSHVKVKVSGAAEPRRFKSGRDLTPAKMVRETRRVAHDWPYDAVSLGYPGTVDAHGPTVDPGNLGRGWVGFDFESAFGCPVRIANDAVLQALGGYRDGRMLFLGLGTGLGSAIVSERVIVPLELGSLPFAGRETIAERVGRAGRRRLGQDRWQRAVVRVVSMLKDAFLADYVVLGGGNAKHVDPLPPDAYGGQNEDAFTGGVRLWEEIVEPHDRVAAAVWRVVR